MRREKRTCIPTPFCTDEETEVQREWVVDPQAQYP